MCVLVKFLKGCFLKLFCNSIHGDLSLLKDFYPFQSLKIILLMDQVKRENTDCENALISHLVTFDLILQSTEET